MTASVDVMAESRAALLSEEFEQLYGVTPRIFRAPGRVNLIGEHTDYNDGFVMPAAIGFYTYVAVAPASADRLQIHSAQFPERVDLSLNQLEGAPRRHWSDYVRGVAAALQAAGHHLRGANLMISGEVPLGAGLSSSASLEVAIAMALATISELEIPQLEIAKLCQKAEHEYTGTKCGIMDQFVSTFGHDGHALMLDCRSLEYTLLPLPEDVRVVICNTTVKHELAGGEYNRRRADCEAGVATLLPHLPGVKALRDVAPEQLEQYRQTMSDRVYRRCRHVVTEDERVKRAAVSLQSGDLEKFGKLMYASHASLRDDYEVSCPELDLLVELASQQAGVYGARMTGGGFGGCTVNLVRSDYADQFQSQIAKLYEAKIHKPLPVYICSAAQGAGLADVQER